MESKSSRDWAGLPKDMLECISNRLVDPKDFISFRVVCPQWYNAINRDAHSQFHPWILKSEEVAEDGNVLFYCLSSEKYLEINVPELMGRRTRLAGSGAGHLIAIDQDDELSAVLVNPLTGESTKLPRLPEWCRGSLTYGFATDPKMTDGKDVFVVISNWWIEDLQKKIAMWRCGSDDGWATIPPRRLWPAMPQLRSRLAEHGVRTIEDELGAVAADGDMAWASMLYSNLIEHEGKVRFLFEQVDNWFPLPWPVSFTLKDMLGGYLTPVDWADAPEFHDKIILKSCNHPCYVLPASNIFTGLSSKNCIYFFSRQYLEDGKEAEYCLCKWDLLERVSTIVKKLPGVWERSAHGIWFFPTFK
ncbi:hypothetical protein QOZ80_1BG0071940 [Eleusine coracana subsp. coracana]|nr:hypothetical protein QOZ80_1BG0071940 [Eleusine coracana subsp. coracana]